jgi:hypothetical protein
MMSCRNRLAGDGGLTINMDVESDGLIASNPAVTRDFAL